MKQVTTRARFDHIRGEVKPLSRSNDAWCSLARVEARRRNFARRGAARSTGDGVLTYVEPSIAVATKYCGIYASDQKSQAPGVL